MGTKIRRKVHVLDEPIRNNKMKQIQYIKNRKGCWTQVSHQQTKGRYKSIWRQGKQQLMHRYVYQTFKGDIPEGFVVMHLCDNTRCVNPEHLDVGTQRDNVNDMMSKQRNNTARGESQGNSVLTEVDVIDILNSVSCGASIRGLAREYSVAPSAIHNIVTGKSWTHVERPEEFKYTVDTKYHKHR